MMMSLLRAMFWTWAKAFLSMSRKSLIMKTRLPGWVTLRRRETADALFSVASEPVSALTVQLLCLLQRPIKSSTAVLRFHLDVLVL